MSSLSLSLPAYFLPMCLEQRKKNPVTGWEGWVGSLECGKNSIYSNSVTLNVFSVLQPHVEDGFILPLERTSLTAVFVSHIIKRGVGIGHTFYQF